MKCLFLENFRLDDCHEGCYYEVNHRYYPDYILLPNEIGLHRDIMSSNECENGNLTCYNEIINSCTSETCASVSVDHMTSYNSPRHERTNESIFLLKNKVWTTTSSTTGTETTTTETDTTHTHTSTTKTDTTSTQTSTTHTSTSNTDTSTTQTSTTTSTTQTTTIKH